MVPVGDRRGGAARLRRDERGQAVVEFALVAPLFLLILVGMIEIARAYNAYVVLTNLAREGARVAVVANQAVTVDSVEAVILAGVRSAALDPTAVEVTLSNVNGLSGTPARVELRYPYRFSFLGRAGEGLLSGPAITLAAAVEMRNE